jgi:hypothetical protein
MGGTGGGRTGFGLASAFIKTLRLNRKLLLAWQPSNNMRPGSV